MQFRRLPHTLNCDVTLQKKFRKFKQLQLLQHSESLALQCFECWMPMSASLGIAHHFAILSGQTEPKCAFECCHLWCQLTTVLQTFEFSRALQFILSILELLVCSNRHVEGEFSGRVWRCFLGLFRWKCLELQVEMVPDFSCPTTPKNFPSSHRRNCVSTVQYLVGGERYCGGGCAPRTMCGPVDIPEEHLQVSKACTACTCKSEPVSM